jgi:leucyl aminopeptidase
MAQSLSPLHQPDVSLEKGSLEGVKADALLVFISKRSDRKVEKEKGADKKKAGSAAQISVHGLPKPLMERCQLAAESGSVTGATNEVVLFRDANLGAARHLVMVGLGAAADLTHEGIRQAVASGVAATRTAKAKSVAIALDSIPHTTSTADVIVQALVEGAVLGAYSFDEFKEKKSTDRTERVLIVTAQKAKSHERGLETGLVVSDCVNFCRWLGDRPGNRMNPTILADETERAAKGTKLKVQVWDKARIKSEKMGSFLSVAAGSTQDPRFIAMEYKGASNSKRPVCFVGKGLTFDSGGISIKPSAGMEEMKYDMCGGAAVIATMLAIARLKLKINAIAFVPATENMPGPGAVKPGDIAIARNGKSIEINNTDAEGRLILADALVYACEQKPAAIFDAATLTGAMVVALGNVFTGFFTRNDKLAQKVQSAAEASGELVWRMPLTDHHVRDMKGTYADLSNISSSKGAGSSTAAAFLEQFVDRDIPWAHFDVAGTAWHTGDRLPYCPKKGATGAMVRTFLELAKEFA